MWSPEAIAATQPATWDSNKLATLSAKYAPDSSYALQYSASNPSPGTGRTGFMYVPPNNYPFYNDEEQYKPVMQADGGQLSGTWP
jgi:hypothetical protein